MTFGFFCLLILVLVVLVASLAILTLSSADRRRADIEAARLSAEQRVELTTRAFLRAMRDMNRGGGI
ncbi:hypothetical protein [Marmoricola sp. URHB0036]|uniref:hypothetical protein n=1 Tax=Marmoricola sp. URHB0036 TaxID=1298863 RepID=UPI000425EF9D|nr:hypothetical protein [Marmoricola sp. URHB0036]